jgi:hypothetical protein
MEREITRDRKPPVTINGGLLLLFSWLAAAALIWLVAAVAGDVNAWLAKNQHLSGWAQAVGAGLAVIAAWMLTRQQIAAGIAAERERERERRLRHLQAAHLVFSGVLAEAEKMCKADLQNPNDKEDVARGCRTCFAELGTVIIHELPPVVAWQASSAQVFLVQIQDRVNPKGLMTQRDIDTTRRSAVVLARVAKRGQALAWSHVTRTATARELADEREMRWELDRLRAEVDRAIPL